LSRRDQWIADDQSQISNADRAANMEDMEMSIRLGDIAPDFTQESTDGPISFHEWLGDSWGILFSHPKDFTPVCTTELGAVAKLKPEFDKRNVKVIGLSVDPLADHKAWVGDIKETQGVALNFPLLADADLNGQGLAARGWHRKWSRHNVLFLDGHADNLYMDTRFPRGDNWLAWPLR